MLNAELEQQLKEQGYLVFTKWQKFNRFEYFAYATDKSSGKDCLIRAVKTLSGAWSIAIFNHFKDLNNL